MEVDRYYEPPAAEGLQSCTETRSGSLQNQVLRGMRISCTKGSLHPQLSSARLAIRKEKLPGSRISLLASRLEVEVSWRTITFLFLKPPEMPRTIDSNHATLFFK